jgi:TRAP-type C4-dicarboxylate transport system substrate-binding protein
MKPQKTAVEWLAEQVNSAKWKSADVTDRKAIIEQAKEMELEQRKESYKNGFVNGQLDAYM